MKDFFKRGSSNTESSASDETSQSQPKTRSNPVLAEYLRKNPADASDARPAVQPQMPKPGDISTSSIFQDGNVALDQSRPSESAIGEVEGGLPGRKTAVMARYFDPDPNARERWERKKVIQLVRRGGRLTHAQMLKRTERQHTVRSHLLKTSVKKLGMLARQIAGKTLDDAIVQMRFSKKKAAVEVLAQLEAARDEAVVVRGMGLGKVVDPETAEQDRTARGTAAAAAEREAEPVEIQLKDGRRHTVADPSRIYVDQAWVGRGPYEKKPEFRARGRVNLLRMPNTTISLLLKEEATRVREWREREAKRRRQRTGDKVWTAMPDRPIQIQRQWYSW